MGPGPILVALDGSPRAPGVLRVAMHLAHKLGARLWLFRAVGLPVEFSLERYPVAPSQLGPFLLERARQDLDAIARDLPPEVVAGVSTELGTAWDAVCTEAKKVDASLIVIGAQGYGRFDRLLGTNAAKIVNHADRAVLVVRSPERMP